MSCLNGGVEEVIAAEVCWVNVFVYIGKYTVHMIIMRYLFHK